MNERLIFLDRDGEQIGKFAVEIQTEYREAAGWILWKEPFGYEFMPHLYRHYSLTELVQITNELAQIQRRWGGKP